MIAGDRRCPALRPRYAKRASLRIKSINAQLSSRQFMTLILRQSRIHSHGCYTTRPIRKGTVIIEYVGECLTSDQADDLYEDFPNTYLFGLDGGKKIIDGYGVA